MITPNAPNIFFYWEIAIIAAGTTYLVYRLNYSKTYQSAYEESANTRISLAEKLRKLPLSYFGKKDLRDLTSTLMNDTSVVEQSLPGEVPFIGLLLSFNVKLFSQILSKRKK